MEDDQPGARPRAARLQRRRRAAAMEAGDSELPDDVARPPSPRALKHIVVQVGEQILGEQVQLDVQSGGLTQLGAEVQFHLAYRDGRAVRP